MEVAGIFVFLPTKDVMIMDYTRIPRALIYKNRTEIDDFPINGDEYNTLESQFYKKLIKYAFIKRTWQGPDYLLKIFNNAYYICTLILLEKEPTVYIARYKIIASENSEDYNLRFNVMPATMALVYNLLEYYVGMDASGDLMKDICEGFHNWEDPNDYNEWMETFDELLIKTYKPISDIPSFTPRNLYEAITDDDIEGEKLALGINYILKKLADTNEAKICLPVLYNRLSTTPSSPTIERAIKQTTIALHNIGIALPSIITQDKGNECATGQVIGTNAEFDDDNLNDIKKMEIDERIIFFVMALGLDLRGDTINQTQMANFISELTGDNAESIRIRIVTLNKEEKKVNQGEIEDFSESTKDAACNVYEYLGKVVKHNPNLRERIRDIRTNISTVYNLNRE